MFSRQGGLSNAGGNSSHLVEFRAGRMNLIGKMVHPDTRKGLVYMTQSEDGLMHFCWKNRTTGKVRSTHYNLHLTTLVNVVFVFTGGRRLDCVSR